VSAAGVRLRTVGVRAGARGRLVAGVIKDARRRQRRRHLAAAAATGTALAVVLVLVLPSGGARQPTGPLGGHSPQVAQAVAAGASHRLAPCPSTSAPTGTYPANQYGQTYGSSAGVCPSQRPDLIKAAGPSTGGHGPVDGYVIKAQLAKAEGDDVNSPQAAVDWTKAHAGKSTTIPLYARDGKTVIGHFAIQGGPPPTMKPPSR
jgi:hypothetical protein